MSKAPPGEIFYDANFAKRAMSVPAVRHSADCFLTSFVSSFGPLSGVFNKENTCTADNYRSARLQGDANEAARRRDLKCSSTKLISPFGRFIKYFTEPGL